MNTKHLQYSLDLNYSQAKQLQTKHNQHLKKLQQINTTSHIPKIKKQANSLKHLSESMNKYKEINKHFKDKQFDEKKHFEDRKMLKSLCQIQRSKQKLYTSSQKDRKQYKIRKENMGRIMQSLRNKEIQNQNLKIALRIHRHQDKHSSFKKKINHDINQYEKLKYHMQKIKDHPNFSQDPTAHKKKMYDLMLSEQQQNTSSRYISSDKEKKRSIKFYTEMSLQNQEAIEEDLLKKRSINTEQLIGLLNDNDANKTKQKKIVNDLRPSKSKKNSMKLPNISKSKSTGRLKSSSALSGDTYKEKDLHRKSQNEKISSKRHVKLRSKKQIKHENDKQTQKLEETLLLKNNSQIISEDIKTSQVGQGQKEE